MATLVLSGKSLHQVFNNLNNIDIATEIDDLDQRIRSINLEAAGIQNVPSFQELIQTFSTIKKELIISRISIKSFAKSTISRVASLEHTINTIEEKPTKSRFGLKLAANQMLNIIKLYDETVPEAENHIAEVNNLLKRVDQLILILKDIFGSHYTQKMNDWKGKQISFGHVRRKRSDDSVKSLFDSVFGKSTDNAASSSIKASGADNNDLTLSKQTTKSKQEDKADTEAKTSNENHDHVIALLKSVAGETAVNVVGGIIKSLGEDSKDVPMVEQVTGIMKEGILGAIEKVSRESKGNELSTALTKSILGLVGTVATIQTTGWSLQSVGALIAQIIGSSKASSVLADYLTNSRIEEIKKTMEEARNELVKAENQLQEYIIFERAIDESYQKILQKVADKKNEISRQENLLEQVLFRYHQNSLQNAIDSMEFVQAKFSYTTIQLRSKIVPFDELKSKLEQLVHVLNLEDPEERLLELNLNDKAKVDNMILNVKNACNNFIYKRLTQEYTNFDVGI